MGDFWLLEVNSCGFSGIMGVGMRLWWVEELSACLGSRGGVFR